MSRYKNQKSGLKRQDFLIKDGWFDTVIKPPGSMHQQQFQMSDCENTNLFIFDTSACVYIDRCKHCCIFIGPCQGSVFLRNCVQCIVISISKQFRVRDSFQCIVSLFCESQPVIESSFDMYFSCFPSWGYNSLLQQMMSIGLSKWNNNWWDIYDFTKNLDKPNYKIKKLRQKQDLNMKQFLYSLQKVGLQNITSTIPKTQGIKDGVPNCENTSILVFKSSTIFNIESKINDLKIIQTRSYIPDNQLLILLNLSQSIEYVFIKIQKSTKYEPIINKLNPLKRINEVTEELNNMIFVPFKDEH